MKKLILIAMALVLASSLVFAQTGKDTKSATTNSKLEQEFTQLYRAWDCALVKVDLKALESMYSDEYRLTSTEGTILTRSELLADLKSGKWVVSSAFTDELKVTRYGDTAVVTARWTAKEMYAGKDVNDQSRFMDVWVKRAGRWQVAASHVSSARDTEADAIQKITKLSKEWDDAYVHFDEKAIERIMADDYVETSSLGTVTSKQKSMAAFKSGEESVSSLLSDDLKINVCGNTAVVTGRWTGSGKSKGNEWNGVFHFTDTWVRRNGNWQIVADHSSKIEGK